MGNMVGCIAGKHGDTAMGEVEVIKALEGGQVDAGLVSDLMWSRAVVIYIPLFKMFFSQHTEASL